MNRLGLGVYLVCVVAVAGLPLGRSEIDGAEDGVATPELEINWDALEIDSELTVTGELGVYGSEPHSYLALAVEDPASQSGTRLVQAQGELLEELYLLQGQAVTLIGIVIRAEIGPGFPAALNVHEFVLVKEEQ